MQRKVYRAYLSTYVVGQTSNYNLRYMVEAMNEGSDEVKRIGNSAPRQHRKRLRSPLS